VYYCHRKFKFKFTFFHLIFFNSEIEISITYFVEQINRILIFVHIFQHYSSAVKGKCFYFHYHGWILLLWSSRFGVWVLPIFSLHVRWVYRNKDNWSLVDSIASHNVLFIFDLTSAFLAYPLHIFDSIQLAVLIWESSICVCHVVAGDMTPLWTTP